MRITSNQLANIVRRSVADNAERLYKAQETVSTEKLVNRPSDDPLAMGRILDYRTTLSSLDQYVRNITQAKMRIEFSEMQVEEIQNQLQTAKILAIDQSSIDAATRNQAAEDIQNIYDRLLEIANSKLGDDYLFAGNKSGARPVDCAEVTCLAESELNSGQYFNVGGSSGYYVWYNIDGVGTDPGVAGMTGIEVAISDGDSASEVATKTVEAINADGNFSSKVTTSDPKRIQLLNLDGETSPLISNVSTGFTMHTTRFEETPPFTECTEVSFCPPEDLKDGDYFTLGSDYYVWYDTDGNGSDPGATISALSGKKGIEVEVIDADGDSDVEANDVAKQTVAAINAWEDPPGSAVFESSLTEDDDTRIEIAYPDGSPPEISKHAESGFTLHTVKYNGDDGELAFAVSKTLKIKGNVTGNEIFTGEGLSDGVNIFDKLKALKDALEAPTYDSGWISSIKDDLIKGLDQV